MENEEFKVEIINDTSRRIETGQVLDNSNADAFYYQLMRLYNAEVGTILIDMTRLEFMSSAGIGSILGVVELFRERNGDIMLAGVNEKILHILDVLNLTEYLTICPTMEEATARCVK